jgi:integrase
MATTMEVTLAHTPAPHTEDPAGSWTALGTAERRHAATVAAHARDADALVSLTQAYLTLHGRSGGRVSAHTQRVYATGVRILVADWRQVDLLDPPPDAGAAWLRRLEASGAWRKDGSIAAASPSTLRVRLAAARVLYRALRWAGATTADPFADAHAAPERTAPWDKRQPYPPEHLAQLLAVAVPLDRVIVLLGSHAGLRAAELSALTWSDIDLQQQRLLVRQGKGGKQRLVPISRSLTAALQQLPSGEGRVVALSDSGLRKRLRLLCARAGVPYLGLHALRHSAGTRLVREGATLEDAARHLGHASIATTRVYAKWSDEQLKQRVGDW